ncbi:putative Ubiquitin fusion degradation protein 1 [Zalerion maritima]|uniref:Ubiquitin fusion degradation protein 1 n=1 Tax=Zalerion maritima TaxID=339359 RepID=A0AAD5RQJ0_9PEZI|nr:putative Ubiquitin fusion degradation protein 1 [Zalerion maritima]
MNSNNDNLELHLDQISRECPDLSNTLTTKIIGSKSDLTTREACHPTSSIAGVETESALDTRSGLQNTPEEEQRLQEELLVQLHEDYNLEEPDLEEDFDFDSNFGSEGEAYREELNEFFSHNEVRSDGEFDLQDELDDYCEIILANEISHSFADKLGIEMFNGGYDMGGYSRRPQRFDEYYRCYPLAMAPGAERPELNYGSKIFLPPSALDKVSRMHVQWPLLMELSNGAKGTHSHCGVLEFVAEEGRAYIPQWMMVTLQLDVGDMIQVRTTSLGLAKQVKLQPQSTKFLDITDPRAVLERSFRNFATLTKGDKFNFEYNDEVYEMAVLDVQPTSDKMGVCMIETDVSVEFAPPVGYVEPERGSGTSTPRSGMMGPGGTRHGVPTGGVLHSQGAMADDINYNAIKPSALAATANNFHGEGKSISNKPKKPSALKSSSAVDENAAVAGMRQNGPKPLRLPPNKLFFGYDVVPLKTKAEKEQDAENAMRPHFAGQGQTLRPGGKKKVDHAETKAPKAEEKATPTVGRRLDGKPVDTASGKTAEAKPADQPGGSRRLDGKPVD